VDEVDEPAVVLVPPAVVPVPPAAAPKRDAKVLATVEPDDELASWFFSTRIPP
jgi:hypothetical protein